MKTREEIENRILNNKNGPRTQEGRDRISQGMKRYWAEYRRIKAELKAKGALKMK